MTENVDGWTITAEPWKYGEEWIVRAHKPSPTPLLRRMVAVSFRHDGLTEREAVEKALPMLKEKMAQQS